MRGWLILWALGLTMVGLATLAISRWGSPSPQNWIVFVPAGNYRASIICWRGFDRGCELRGSRKEMIVGRVIVWLDAFWADAGLVTRAQYEKCRKEGVCRGEQRAPEGGLRCKNLNSIAFVAFEDARAYCARRGWRLPTPDEFERMARWTDGRGFAAGNRVESDPPCKEQPSPEGIRDLNLHFQWVSSPDGEGGLQGVPTSFNFLPIEFEEQAFRCVRSANPTNVGKAIVLPDQDDPWVKALY